MQIPIEGHVYILNESDAHRILTGLTEVSEMIWEALASRKLKLTMDGDEGETELSPPSTYDPPPLDRLF